MYILLIYILYAVILSIICFDSNNFFIMSQTGFSTRRNKVKKLNNTNVFDKEKCLNGSDGNIDFL